MTLMSGPPSSTNGGKAGALIVVTWVELYGVGVCSHPESFSRERNLCHAVASSGLCRCRALGIYSLIRCGLGSRWQTARKGEQRPKTSS